VVHYQIIGTPMPSFADSVTPRRPWDLVHYIQRLIRLRENTTGAPPSAPIKLHHETILWRLVVRGMFFDTRNQR